MKDFLNEYYKKVSGNKTEVFEKILKVAMSEQMKNKKQFLMYFVMANLS